MIAQAPLRVVLVLFLFLVSSARVGAQEVPAGTTPPLPVPGTVPVVQDPEAEEEEPVKISSSEVSISEHGEVDVVVQNDHIINVLHKLFALARRSFIPSPSVDVVINASLSRVRFDEALDHLLRPNGLGWIQEGDVVEVYTLTELEELGLVKANLISRTISLDYVRAEEATQFAQHLLSKDGFMDFTKDLDVEAEEGVQVITAGQTVGGSEEIYTPKKDEFALRNDVIVHDHPENVALIERFLEDLDVRPPQVLIEATIIQTRLTEETAFGVDFALLGDVQFNDFFGFPSSYNPLDFFPPDPSMPPSPPGVALEPDNNGFIVSSPGNTGAGEGTLKVGITSDNVGVFIRALDRVTDVSLLSNPKVLVLNRQRSRILVGEKVSYLLTTVVENKVMQSLEFIDTGIVLDIRPYILRNGQVRLELSPKVSEVDFRQTIVDGQVTEIPDETIRTITTDVLVPEGSTAVLGGLFREDSEQIRSQVPVLGDVPLLGRAFRGDDDVIQQWEVIFLIRPIVMHHDTLVEQGERAEEYEQAVRVGTREGLLPWSRERLSSWRNLRAEQLAAEGDVDEALWYLRRSLQLHPLQPNAIRMRQHLMSSTETWPTKSMLERIVHENTATGDDS